MTTTTSSRHRVIVTGPGTRAATAPASCRAITRLTVLCVVPLMTAAPR